jgi:hypothetical protein
LRPVTLRVSALACLAAGALGCASTPKPAPAAGTEPAVAPTAPTAPTTPSEQGSPAAARAPASESGLRFAVEPADAEISVDGRAFGTVAELAGQGGILNLAPGIYQVSLKAAGFVTWRAEVALHSGTETIRAKLAKKP